MSHGLIDKADILMQKNPDLDREEALDILFEKQDTEMELEEEETEEPQSALLQALQRPVE